MKHHFLIPYFGNKREEVELIYDTIKHKINNKSIIIEPYCGTSAISYYIWTKHPNLKFIINDNNKYIYELYNIIKDQEKLNKLYFDLLELYDRIKTKEEYNELKKEDTLINYLYLNKVYSIRAGLYPTNKMVNRTTFDTILNAPIIEFIRNANIEILNKDAIELIEEYKDNKHAMLFIDPPYLNTDNRYYKEPSFKIYEYVNNNNFMKMNALFIFCLNNNWILDLLFKYFIKVEYDKKYQTTKTPIKHCLYINKKI